MSQITRDMTHITRCSMQFRSEQFAPMGFKACHAAYLSQICRNPGISQDKLARAICINKSNVARQAVVLEEDGYINRIPDPDDKRVMRLYPTDKALELQPKIHEVFTAWSDLVTQDLTEEERTQLGQLLEKVKLRATRWMEEH